MTSFYFTEKDVERLEEQAVQIRQDIISMIHAAKAGHPEEHNRILMESIRELDKQGYGAIADRLNEIAAQK